GKGREYPTHYGAGGWLVLRHTRRRQRQPPVVERQTVHDLVVVVERRGLRAVDVRGRVGSFEIDHTATALVEKRMVHDIIEVVLFVPHNLLGTTPRPFGCCGFRVVHIAP